MTIKLTCQSNHIERPIHEACHQNLHCTFSYYYVIGTMVCCNILKRRNLQYTNEKTNTLVTTCINHQLNAQFLYSLIIYITLCSSTCFEHRCAHLQEERKIVCIQYLVSSHWKTIIGLMLLKCGLIYY